MNSENKPHLVLVGFDEEQAGAVDFRNYAVCAVISRRRYAAMSPVMRLQFTRIGVLDVPSARDLGEYERAYDEIEEMVVGWSAEIGPPAAVVSLYEHTTIPAARLRERFGLPGTSVPTAVLCRDKVRMKQAMVEHGIPAPRFLPVDAGTSMAGIEAWLSAATGKVVLKPRAQAASYGVVIFGSATEAAGHLRSAGITGEAELEEFVDAPVCHLDGIVRDGEIVFFSASRYLQTCLEFQADTVPMGSVTLADREVVARARAFTERVLSAVGLRDSSFHLEAFLVSGDFVFLEVGARFGGAHIEPHVRAAYGVDLAAESFLAGLLAPTRVSGPADAVDRRADVTGWLMMPRTEEHACVVRGARGMDVLPESVVAAEVPAPGTCLPPKGGGLVALGAFCLAAPDTDTLVADIDRLSRSFTVLTERVESAAP